METELLITHVGVQLIADIPPHRLKSVIKNRMYYLNRKKKKLFNKYLI